MSRAGPGLTRDAVLSTALAIIDESGLENCTMRSVASALGVEAMSLYWHVPGKEALLAGVVEKILDELAAQKPPHDDWSAWMTAFGHAFRGVLLRHANAVPLIVPRAVRTFGATGVIVDLGLVDTLEAAGFERSAAIRGVRTFARFVIGSTLFEINNPVSEEDPTPSAASAREEILESISTDDPAEVFAFGLRVVVDGLEAHLGRR